MKKNIIQTGRRNDFFTTLIFHHILGIGKYDLKQKDDYTREICVSKLLIIFIFILIKLNVTNNYNISILKRNVY